MDKYSIKILRIGLVILIGGLLFKMIENTIKLFNQNETIVFLRNDLTLMETLSFKGDPSVNILGSIVLISIFFYLFKKLYDINK